MNILIIALKIIGVIAFIVISIPLYFRISFHIKHGFQMKSSLSISYFKSGKKISYCSDLEWGDWSALFLEGIDTETAEIVGEHHIKDSNSVYWMAELIKGADPKTYEVLDWAFSKDANKVFFYSQTIVGADASSFKRLWGHYSVDKNFIFYKDEKISRFDESIEWQKGESKEAEKWFISPKVKFYRGEAQKV